MIWLGVIIKIISKVIVEDGGHFTFLAIKSIYNLLV